jgi:hypothetical protein
MGNNLAGLFGGKPDPGLDKYAGLVVAWMVLAPILAVAIVLILNYLHP